MKNYELFEKKYLKEEEYSFDEYFKRMLVHMRRMENEEPYKKAIEARLYGLDDWQEQWEAFGLEVGVCQASRLKS